MAQYTERQISQIVEKVIAKLSTDGGLPAASRGPVIQSRSFSQEDGVFGDPESAIAAATKAYQQVQGIPLEVRGKAIEAIRQLTREQAVELSHKAVAETGLGRVEDKIQKNLLAANKTPGMEILSPRSFTGDRGLCLDERAPYGVIGSITPCTNATETIINNAISMVAGGNSVVFNVHPSAKDVLNGLVRDLNRAMVAAGYPANVLCSVGQPTIESAQALMKHAGIRLLVVTGGPAVVQAAMGSGKKCIAAGPGNPPALVDETADLCAAARNIGAGHSLDNNIVCIIEKEVIAVASIADRLKEELGRAGGYVVKDRDLQKLTDVCIEDGHAARDCVGKNASVILRKIGITVSDDVRFALVEVPDESHPLVQVEQLMPVLPLFRVRNAEEGIQAAVRVEKGCFHTATCHSKNIDVLHNMARAVNTSIFVKNGPSFAGLGMGGEGYTSWTIAGPTGEGLTTAWNFTRARRCTLVDSFRIV